MPGKTALSARTADRHALYQASVQVPEADVRFLDRVFTNLHGRRPVTLREDFCGTAFLAATWVKSRTGRIAYGVDLCRDTMAWGLEHNIRPLGERARNVRLSRANVLTPKKPRVDLQVAFNFSYWIFKERAVLLRYFHAARESIRREGLFVLDIHGGWESFQPVTERKRIPGARYVWEQGTFNPITHDIECFIHFEFPDGSRLRKAFAYHWRWWSLREVVDVLKDAGFRRVEVYWEGTEQGTKRGDGVFRLATRADNDPSWVSYLVARP